MNDKTTTGPSMYSSGFQAYHREEMELHRDEELCIACGLPTGTYGVSVCSDGCGAYLDDQRAALGEPDGKDYSDLEGA